jgi:predicted HicB family RNase H-like nuclease
MSSKDHKTNFMTEYKGYTCHFAFDEADKLFHGKVANSHYLIVFEGKSIRELHQTFYTAIDEHLKWCEKYGKKQENTYYFL